MSDMNQDRSSNPSSKPLSQPDLDGHFGVYGGRFVPETLMSPLEELEQAYREACSDSSFQEELGHLLKHYVGRPTPLYRADRLSRRVGATVYLKREDLAHTGAHKINNAMGQALLARRMKKRRIIAETGAGQHGVATATVCALLELECEIYMGTEDMLRQALNVFRMELLGAQVTPVDAGSCTLKDAINEAMRDWVTHVDTTHYLLGSVLGAHPYPMMVRDFQSVIGREAEEQILDQQGRLPELLIACVGGGSNSIGLFHQFLKHPQIEMIGVEAGGYGPELGEHAARFQGGRQGVLHGTFSYVLQDEGGQIAMTHSISAGLDYPSIGPEHALLHDLGRIKYTAVSDQEALEAFDQLNQLEGLMPALESAHAVAHLLRMAEDGTLSELGENPVVIVNLSGRGDKDVETVRDLRHQE